MAVIKTPDGFDSQSWEIVGFLQNIDNGAIDAASGSATNTQSSTKALLEQT
jgi:hypothetical protein